MYSIQKSCHTPAACAYDRIHQQQRRKARWQKEAKAATTAGHGRLGVRKRWRCRDAAQNGHSLHFREKCGGRKQAKPR